MNRTKFQYDPSNPSKLRLQIPQSEKRTVQQLKEHYDVEKELANRLRNADKEQRAKLYTSLYNELHQRVPQNSQAAKKTDPIAQKESIRHQLHFLIRFLKPSDTYLEVGAGDCSLAVEVAKTVHQVHAIDVCENIAEGITTPENFNLTIVSDGFSIPVPKASIDVAYSNQLMEHVHPEDAIDQLQNIYQVLKPNGQYVCLTPNRYSGPHDISKYFSEVAEGFHLKEYTNTELNQLFRENGFSKVFVYWGIKGRFVKWPIFPCMIFEWFLNMLPDGIVKRIAAIRPIYSFLGAIVVAIK